MLVSFLLGLRGQGKGQRDTQERNEDEKEGDKDRRISCQLAQLCVCASLSPHVACVCMFFSLYDEVAGR